MVSAESMVPKQKSAKLGIATGTQNYKAFAVHIVVFLLRSAKLKDVKVIVVVNYGVVKNMGQRVQSVVFLAA